MRRRARPNARYEEAQRDERSPNRTPIHWRCHGLDCQRRRLRMPQIEGALCRLGALHRRRRALRLPGLRRRCALRRLETSGCGVLCFLVGALRAFLYLVGQTSRARFDIVGRFAHQAVFGGRHRQQSADRRAKRESDSRQHDWLLLAQRDEALALVDDVAANRRRRLPHRRYGAARVNDACALARDL